MKRYEVRMRRREDAYRTMQVVAGSPKAAQRRALEIARDATEEKDGEDAGEWCDNTYGRPVVMSVEETE